MLSAKLGDYKIVNGVLDLPFANDGDYILIEYPSKNEGVYKYPLTGLKDEEFRGWISVRNIPDEFIELVEEIEAYKKNNPVGGLQSESFGGYSYTKATNKDGGLFDWHDVYKQRLNEWRKL